MYRGSFGPVRTAIISACAWCDFSSEALVVPIHRAIEAIRPLAFRGQDSEDATITGRCNVSRVSCGFVNELKETVERDLAPLSVTIGRDLQRALKGAIDKELEALNTAIGSTTGTNLTED